MTGQFPLQGVRIHLAGSISDDSSDENRERISGFVRKLTAAILREGGTLIHGSHPTFQAPLRAAAEPFVKFGGARDSLVLVRSARFASMPAELAEIEAQRSYAAVQLIPWLPNQNDPVKGRDLVSLREWMAERCDAVVAVGGKHYDVNKAAAGTPAELEEALRRGKPGFVVGGFGGAVMGYLNDNSSVFARLRNGLSEQDNQTLANNVDVDEVVLRILQQLKLLPLAPQSISSGRLFRILALDGGGLRGVFTAAVLAKWDEMLKSDHHDGLAKHFDLIAGTSTGAILAIGLGLGRSPLEILNFYRNQGPAIFPAHQELRHWLTSKYKSKTLRSTLASILQTSSLSDSLCRLVIPTVRAVHGEAEVITTAHSPDRVAYRDMSALDAALASSAAPTYFDEAKYNAPVAGQSFLDGGIWANNPVLPAIAEAVCYLDTPIDRIDVLSIGTLAYETDFTNCLSGGKAIWAPSSADLFFSAQERAATMLADCLLSRARHLRINQQTPTPIELGEATKIDEMAQRGMNVAQDWFPAVRSRFLDGVHAPAWRSEVP